MTDDRWVMTASGDPSCRLPTADRPLRIGEWRALLGAAPEATATGPLTAEFHLSPNAETARTAADLASREVSCCAFFRFDLHISADDLLLRATVPTGHEPVVAGLLAMADR